MIFTLPIFASLLDMRGAIEAKQVAQQQVETQRQVLAQREIEAQQKVATAKGEAESILVVAQGQAKANDALSRSISLDPRAVQGHREMEWDFTSSLWRSRPLHRLGQDGWFVWRNGRKQEIS